MEAKNMIGGIVSLAVVVICVAAIMMPILNDATTTHETFDNTDYAYYQMKELELGDSWTYSSGTWTFDGEEIDLGDDDEISVITTDTLVIRQNSRGYGTTYGTVSAATTEVIEVDSNTVLQVNTGNNVAFTKGYGFTQSGDYVMKTYTDSAYVNGDTPIWVSGLTYAVNGDSSSGLLVTVSGTLDDGFTVSATKLKNGSVSSVTAGEYTVNYEEVDGFEDLYKITSIQFDLTGERTGIEGTFTKAATYSTFILPKEITAERTVHFSDGENALISAIPVIVIVSLVIAAVGVMVTRRD